MNSVTEAATETQPDDPAHPTVQLNRAVYSWSAHLRFWLVMLLGLAADLWTKHWAQATLQDRSGRPVIENILLFHYSTNKGALFGMGEGWTRLFIVASVLALVFVLYVFAKSDRRQRSFHIALGIILAGALGNLYDRVFRDGSVRDFIKIALKIGEFELWPWVFNVADMLLVCGVSVLMFNIWLGRKHPRKSECEQSNTAA